LKERFPIEDSRWRKCENESRFAFENIKELYNKLRPAEKDQYKRNEANLEKDFIRPILDILGHSYDVQQSIYFVYRSAEKPDYTLFPSEDVRQTVKNDRDRYIEAVIGLAEAKAWDIELDKTTKLGPKKYGNPSLQINNYLRDASKPWGILTNGRKWRLYNKETSLQLDSYYEVDLVKLIEEGDLESFKFFYLFFRCEAFVGSPSQPSFLDDVLHSSIRYSQELEESVKENVYESLRLLIKGFFEHPDNDFDEKNLDEIHQNCLILLYRLLFILYAEAKGLLPCDNAFYREKSLESIRHEIKVELDKSPSSLDVSGDTYWAKLRWLFKLVNEGSEARNIPREKLYIPPYNGGLFDSKKHPFLEKSQVGDKYLAEAIHKLSWAGSGGGNQGGYVDYNTLSIRHLGSIYEGLLEYKPEIASDDLVIVKEKGREVFKKAESTSTPQKGKNGGCISKGDIYLRTDKGERKATGSYYTPDDIVKYIVESTLEPIIKEIEKRGLKGKDFVQEILSIRVLDPAMGSGHFLVEATSFLATRIVEALAEMDEDVESIPLEDVLWARREIARRCIYGVDLNPLAVELAKVSLWLHTVTKDKPLSFLDHHLKCGNSLMGARLSSLKKYPKEKRTSDDNTEKTTLPSFISQIFIDHLIEKIRELDVIGDDSLQDIRRKEQLLDEFKSLPEYIKTKAFADVYTSIFFGNEVKPTQKKTGPEVYYDLIWSLQYPSNWDSKTQTDWFKDSLRIAKEKSFFHWELEFPDVFFSSKGRINGSGFDAVIGNPPYVRIYRGRISEDDVSYFYEVFKTAHKKFDLYILFIELGLDLLASDGRFSMIIPDKWLSVPYGEPLRMKILNLRFESLADLRHISVFEGVGVANVIPVIVKSEAIKGDNVNILLGDRLPSGHIQISPSCSIEQSSFTLLPQSQIRLEVTIHSGDLIQKIQGRSLSLGKICYVNWGLRTGTEEKTTQMIADTKLSPRYKQLIRGEDIEGRYSLLHPPRFIDYDTERLYNPMFPEFFENPKIIFRKISGHRGLLAVSDDTGSYGFSTVIIAVRHTSIDGVKRAGVIPPTPESKEYDNLWYLLALVNSRLVNWYHDRLLSDKLCVVPNSVKELPICKINFTTSQKDRANLLRKGEELYESYLVDSKIDVYRGFIHDRLTAVPEEADVIHDLLAFLAKKMTEMNNERNLKVKAFLGWIESPLGLGIKIDELQNRTKFSEFHIHPSLGNPKAREDLEKVLVTNKIKLNSSLLEKFKQEYDSTARIIKPLQQRIQSTDALIDFLIYRLFDLTTDEIALIESIDEAEVKKKYGL